MNTPNRNLNFAASLIVMIALSACWLVISAGCGQGPAVSRPNKPLPQTQQVESTPESSLK